MINLEYLEKDHRTLQMNTAQSSMIKIRYQIKFVSQYASVSSVSFGGKEKKESSVPSFFCYFIQVGINWPLFFFH